MGQIGAHVKKKLVGMKRFPIPTTLFFLVHVNQLKPNFTDKYRILLEYIKYVLSPLT